MFCSAWMNIFCLQLRRKKGLLILFSFGFQSPVACANMHRQDDVSNPNYSVLIIYLLHWNVIINLGSIIYEKLTNNIQ